MKRKIVFFILILAGITSFCFLAKGKTISGTDTLRLVDFDMSPTGTAYSSINTALLNESAFTKKFGKPIKFSTEYSEVEESNVNHYVYTGAEAWFTKNRLGALAFTKPNYHFVMLNGNAVKVRDAISTVANMFPSSWAAKTSNQVFVNLRNSRGPVDMTVMFEFDPKTKMITTISIQ
ncbi:MAG: hypothetical protein JWN76_433 [Chitinophagaceae bacterium]|nr:hypothetical protein [Chitinophagaceae bacterium]